MLNRPTRKPLFEINVFSTYICVYVASEQAQSRRAHPDFFALELTESQEHQEN